MKTKIFILGLMIYLLFPLTIFSQGWTDITPPGMGLIYNVRGFDFQNSHFEIFVWNDSMGYKLDDTFQWQGILAYYSYLCDPITPEYAVHYLTDIAKAYTNPDFVYNFFVRGGCIVECYTMLFSDTTGQISNQNEIKFFDDFSCAGLHARIAVSPLDKYEFYFTFLDSLYYSSDGGETIYGISSPDPEEYSPRLTFLAMHPHQPAMLFTSGFESSRNSYFLYKSDDMGNTWNDVLGFEIRHMEFHPANPSIVFAVSDNGIYKSSDQGDSWLRVLIGDFWSIEIDPGNPDIIYAGNRYGALYQSSDEGVHWNLYNNTFSNLAVLGIYLSSNNDTLIVASIDGVFKVYDSYIVGIETHPEIVTGIELQQNYPNPFNPETAISFQLSAISYVELEIFDVSGRKVATLVNKNLPPGEYEVVWDGRDDAGQAVGSGVYIYRLKAGEFIQSRKMLLIR